MLWGTIYTGKENLFDINAIRVSHRTLLKLELFFHIHVQNCMMLKFKTELSELDALFPQGLFERDSPYHLWGTVTRLIVYYVESRLTTLGVTLSCRKPNRKMLNNSPRPQKDNKKNSIVDVHKVQPSREFTCLRNMGYRMLYGSP